MALTAGTLEYLISVDSTKLNSGLNKAEKDVKGFGDRLSAWAVAKGQILSRLAEKAVSATVGLTKQAVEDSKSFDKAMSQYIATRGASVDDLKKQNSEYAKEFTKMNKFAREMGLKGKFNATQVAEAMNYMALAGYKTEETMRILPQVLDLAAAGNMDLARASDVVTDTQKAFGLTLEDTEVLVDQMAKTASITNTSVEQLGDAFLTVGANAKRMGTDSKMTKELSAMLGVLADNGIKGAEGGTAMRNVLLRLTGPASKAAKELRKIGVEAYTTEGELRSLPEIFLQMRDALEGKTDKERAAIFEKAFNVRDVRSIEALLGTTEKKWKELFDAIEKAYEEDAAGKMAETQLDNLAGDAEKLKNQLLETKLTLLEGLTPTLRTVTKTGTLFVKRLTEAFRKKGFRGAIEEAEAIFDRFIQNLKKSNNPVLQKVGEALEKVQTVAKFVKDALTDLPGTIERLKESDSPLIKGLGAALDAAYQTGLLLKNLLLDFPGTVESLKSSESPFLQVLGAALDGVYQTGMLLLGLLTDFPGTVEQLQASDSPLLHTLGDLLQGVADAVQLVIDLFTDFPGTLQSLQESDVPFLRALGATIDFVYQAATLLYNLLTDFPGTVESLQESDSPFLRVLGEALQGVADVVQLVIDLINDFPGTIQKLEQSDNPVLNVLAEALKALKNIIDAVVIAFEQGIPEAIAALREADDPLSNLLGGGLQLLYDVCMWFMENLGLSGTINTIVGAFLGFKAVTISATLLTFLARLKQLGSLGAIRDVLSYLQGGGGTVPPGGADVVSGAGGTDVIATAGKMSLLQKFGAFGLTGLTMLAPGLIAGMAKSLIPKEQQLGEEEHVLGARGTLEEAEAAKEWAETWNEIAKTDINSEKFGELHTRAKELAEMFQDSELWGKLHEYMVANDIMAGKTEINTDVIDKFIQQLQKDVNGAPLEANVKPQAGAAKKIAAEVGPVTLEAVLHVGGGVTPGSKPEMGLTEGGTPKGGGGSATLYYTKDALAKGNWSIPYDNYPALLHRGEMVLNKSQARQYRDGYEGGADVGGVVAKAVNQAMSRVYVMLSGEKVGDLTTKRVKRNINASSYNRLRALGG